MPCEIVAIFNSSGFSAIVGGLLGIGAAIIANKYLLSSKRVEKQLEVAYNLKISQLDTLVSLQTAVQKLGRANVKCCQSLLRDNLRFENGMRKIEPSIDEERHLIGVDVALLNSRVNSPKIRSIVDKAKSFNILMNSDSEIEHFMYESVERVNEALDAIGVEIRSVQESLSKTSDK